MNIRIFDYARCIAMQRVEGKSDGFEPFGSSLERSTVEASTRGKNRSGCTPAEVGKLFIFILLWFLPMPIFLSMMLKSFGPYLHNVIYTSHF